MARRWASTPQHISAWAAFAGSDTAAFVDGDFAMLENELQPVLRTMRKEGINIVATSGKIGVLVEGRQSYMYIDDYHVVGGS